MLFRPLLIRTLFSCLTATSLAGCDSPRPPFENLPQLSVSATFSVENLCDIGISPRIGLTNVPMSTAMYAVQMTNVDVLLQSPWRETIPLTSQAEIPAGAGRTYVGPCVGDNLRFPPLAPYGFNYRIEVLAEDAAGKPLAYGRVVALVQSPYLTARRQRMQLQQQQQGIRPAAQPGPPAPPSPGPYGGYPYGTAPTVPTSNFGILQ